MRVTLQHGKYPIATFEDLVTATLYVGNQKTTKLAFSVVRTEYVANFNRFLERIVSAMQKTRDLMSDGAKGLGDIRGKMTLHVLQITQLRFTLRFICNNITLHMLYYLLYYTRTIYRAQTSEFDSSKLVGRLEVSPTFWYFNSQNFTTQTSVAWDIKRVPRRLKKVSTYDFISTSLSSLYYIW